MGRYRTVETEKDEQSYDARIWWTFWIVALVCLAYTAWHHYRNYDLIHNGTCIIAEYTEKGGEKLASYRGENGNLIASFTLSGLDPVHEENTVQLYYKDNIYAAEPRRQLQSWLISYGIFGILLVVCSLRLWNIYTHKTTSNQIFSDETEYT